jgi:hypothetical protein
MIVETSAHLGFSNTFLISSTIHLILCDDIFHNIYTINEQVPIGVKRAISLTYKYEDDDNDDKRKEENMVEIFASDKENVCIIARTR